MAYGNPIRSHILAKQKGGAIIGSRLPTHPTNVCDRKGPKGPSKGVPKAAPAEVGSGSHV